MALTCHPNSPHRPDQSLDAAAAVGPANDVAYVVKARPEPKP